MAVGQMAAVREIHGENFVARFNRREIDSHVRLRAAVRLNVRVLGPENLFRPIDRQLFNSVDIFTTAVPTFSGITFGVLVCEHAALRLHHGGTGEIFRCNQFDIFTLPFFLRGNRVENFGIDSAQAAA